MSTDTSRDELTAHILDRAVSAFVGALREVYGEEEINTAFDGIGYVRSSPDRASIMAAELVMAAVNRANILASDMPATVVNKLVAALKATTQEDA